MCEITSQGLSGRKAEADRTVAALEELQNAGVIDNFQLQAILDRILDKLIEELKVS